MVVTLPPDVLACSGAVALFGISTRVRGDCWSRSSKGWCRSAPQYCFDQAEAMAAVLALLPDRALGGCAGFGNGVFSKCGTLCVVLGIL